MAVAVAIPALAFQTVSEDCGVQQPSAADEKPPPKLTASVEKAPRPGLRLARALFFPVVWTNEHGKAVHRSGEILETAEVLQNDFR